MSGLFSGEWSGYYEQYGARHPQRVTIELADGVVRGDGVDGLGEFTIEGEYRSVEGETRVGFIKTYKRAHSILYRGVLDRGGAISGTWEITKAYTGRFALRPVIEDRVHSTRKGSEG